MRPSAALIILLTLVVAALSSLHFATLTDVHGVMVTGKERVTYTDGDQVKSQYMIYTKQETFKNVDSLLALKWNSSDIYGQIQAGQVCDFTVTGFRIRITSSYRNILSAKCH